MNYNPKYCECCEKNCPDYHGMELLHAEQCDCPCHTPEEPRKYNETPKNELSDPASTKVPEILNSEPRAAWEDAQIIFQSFVVDDVGIQLSFNKGEWVLAVSGSKELAVTLGCIEEWKNSLLSDARKEERERVVEYIREEWFRSKAIGPMSFERKVPRILEEARTLPSQEVT